MSSSSSSSSNYDHDYYHQIKQILFLKLHSLCKQCFLEPTPANIDKFCHFLNDIHLHLHDHHLGSCHLDEFNISNFLRPLSSYLFTPFKHIIENLPTICKQSKVPLRFVIEQDWNSNYSSIK